MKKILSILLISSTLFSVAANASNDGKKCSKSCCAESAKSPEKNVDAYDEIEAITWIIGLHKEMSSDEYTKLRVAGKTASDDGTSIEQYLCIYKCSDFVESLLIDFYQDYEYLKMMYNENSPIFKHEMNLLTEDMYEEVQNDPYCNCYLEII